MDRREHTDPPKPIGWVERRPSPEDRRVVLVELSRAGKDEYWFSWKLFHPAGALIRLGA